MFDITDVYRRLITQTKDKSLSDSASVPPQKPFPKANPIGSAEYISRNSTSALMPINLETCLYGDAVIYKCFPGGELALEDILVKKIRSKF